MTAAALVLAACGPAGPVGSAAPSVEATSAPSPAAPPETSTGGAEINPSGDIPDNQAFVPYSPPGATFTTVSRAAGPVVLITYGALSDPDPVTGKSRPNDVQRYEFWHAGQGVTLTLAGPKGADNVDPWRKITDSLRWTL